MRKTKIGFRRSDVYYFIYTAASNLSAQPCKSVRARQVPSARGVRRGVYYKCKGAGELVLLLLLLLRPTYLFCCKSQAATAKMLPLPFTPLPPSLPCLLAPCCTTTHATLHPVQTRFSFVLHAAWGVGGVGSGGRAAESWLYLCTPRHAHKPSNLLMLATGDAGPAQARPPADCFGFCFPCCSSLSPSLLFCSVLLFFSIFLFSFACCCCLTKRINSLATGVLGRSALTPDPAERYAAPSP